MGSDLQNYNTQLTNYTITINRWSGNDWIIFWNTAVISEISFKLSAYSNRVHFKCMCIQPYIAMHVTSTVLNHLEN